MRIHVPEDALSPAPALMALHGYGQPPAAMFRYAREVAPPGTVIVAPEGPQAFYAERWKPEPGQRRVGYGWIADRPRDDAEVRNRVFLGQALGMAAAEHPIDPTRTCVLGYSQGVGVGADFAMHALGRVTGLIGLGGGVPSDGRPALSLWHGRPALWITGTRDRFYPADYNAAVIEALEAAGIDLESAILDLGHDLLDAARERVAAWLAAHWHPTSRNPDSSD